MRRWIWTARCEDIVMDRERQFVRTFIQQRRKPRYLAKLDGGDRAWLLGQLAHHLERDLDERRAIVITSQMPGRNYIYSIVQQLTKATRCYVISEWSEWDGQEFDLEEMFGIVRSVMRGTIICIEPGELAFFEPEMAEDARCLLVRDENRRREAVAMFWGEV